MLELIETDARTEAETLVFRRKGYFCVCRSVLVLHQSWKNAGPAGNEVSSHSCFTETAVTAVVAMLKAHRFVPKYYKEEQITYKQLYSLW